MIECAGLCADCAAHTADECASALCRSALHSRHHEVPQGPRVCEPHTQRATAAARRAVSRAKDDRSAKPAQATRTCRLGPTTPGAPPISTPTPGLLTRQPSLVAYAFQPGFCRRLPSALPFRGPG